LQSCKETALSDSHIGDSQEDIAIETIGFGDDFSVKFGRIIECFDDIGSGKLFKSIRDFIESKIHIIVPRVPRPATRIRIDRIEFHSSAKMSGQVRSIGQ
jgi:hypothetical protein